MHSAHEPRATAFALIAAAAGIERRLDRALSSVHGITFREFHLLDTLAGAGNASVTRVDLARLVGLTPSGVTRALKPLEKLGFVATTKDGRDARRALATLTEHGAELVDNARTVVDDVVDQTPGVADLDRHDRAVVDRVLGRIGVR